MSIMRLPLYNPLESRDGTLTKDARLKNAVLEIVEGAPAIVKRPGIASRTEVPAGPSQGLIGFGPVGFEPPGSNETTYSIFEDKLYFSPAAGGEYTGGVDLAVGVNGTPFGPASEFNFAIYPGPTYPLGLDEWLYPPYRNPFTFPGTNDLIDFLTVNAIIAQMTANYGGVGTWEFSAISPIATGLAAYPSLIGYVLVIGAGHDEDYVQILSV